MRVKQAKALAREWVHEHASVMPGLISAFHTGSSHWQPDDAELAPGSDVDVMLVLAEPPAIKLGKLPFRGVVLDVGYLPPSLLAGADAVLADYHLAGSLREAEIIFDASGDLATLASAVTRDFVKARWVYARAAQARDKVLRYASSIDDAAPFHEQVTSWAFATGVTTHVLLAAGMRNPTIRRRYVAVRELLSDYGRMDFYPSLLELLGCLEMQRIDAERHLAALAEAFDAAASAIKSPFFFAGDISAAARPIAIDGSRELIEQGLHREAVFWLVATYARCQAVLSQDASPDVYGRFDAGFRELLADLGIEGTGDFRRKQEEIAGFLPHLWEVAEGIIEANPAVEP